VRVALAGAVPEHAVPVHGAAFAANRGPLAGHAPEEECRAPFDKIPMTAKAPIGFG
jgi:hypothetical protein